MGFDSCTRTRGMHLSKRLSNNSSQKHNFKPLPATKNNKKVSPPSLGKDELPQQQESVRHEHVSNEVLIPMEAMTIC